MDNVPVKSTDAVVFNFLLYVGINVKPIRSLSLSSDFLFLILLAINCII